VLPRKRRQYNEHNDINVLASKSRCALLVDAEAVDVTPKEEK
jgi:hypothetical protein